MKNISAAILCGGKCSRIGINKAFLEINSKPIIEHIIEVLKKFFDEIIINTNNPELFSKFNLKIINDIVPDKDVFGGLYTILKSIKTEYVFIVPCDMPFLNPELIKFTLEHDYYNYDVVCYSINKKFQPLFGIYKKDCVKFFENAIKNSHFPKLIDIFKEYRAFVIDESKIPAGINIQKSFFNINTEEDYYKAKNNQFSDIPVIGIVAKESKSGKTTLIESLIVRFKNENFKVGVLKHTVHKIEIDKKGKDTYRFYEKGADVIAIDTENEIVIRRRLEKPLPVKYIKDKYFKDVDILIVEGHKGGNFPKIEVIKDDQNEFLFERDSNIIALISNKKIKSSLPQFSFHEIDKIYNFVKTSLKICSN